MVSQEEHAWVSEVRFHVEDASSELIEVSGRGMPAVLGLGAATSALLSAFEYTGGSLMGAGRDPEVDEFERKQQLRKNRRRPIEETVAELGEGRGKMSGQQHRRSSKCVQESTPLATQSDGHRGSSRTMASTSTHHLLKRRELQERQFSFVLTSDRNRSLSDRKSVV